jgi:hypothetical protein
MDFFFKQCVRFEDLSLFSSKFSTFFKKKISNFPGTQYDSHEHSQTIIMQHNAGNDHNSPAFTLHWHVAQARIALAAREATRLAAIEAARIAREAFFAARIRRPENQQQSTNRGLSKSELDELPCINMVPYTVFDSDSIPARPVILLMILLQTEQYLASAGVDPHCSICLVDFQVDTRVRVLPNCLHRFHVECVDRWLATQGGCPLCKALARIPQSP